MRLCMRWLWVEVAQVAFNDSEVPVEPEELFLCVFRVIAPTRPGQLWNYLIEFFHDIPACPGTVFHPGLPVSDYLVMWAVENDVEPVPWNISDRTVQLRETTTFIMLTAVVNTFT